MKKWLIWISITLVVVIVGAAIALPILLPLEKIKNIAVAKMSETLHREVRIDKISFNIFTGLQLKGLFIGNRQGFTNAPFIAAKQINLRFNLWSIILEKKIRIGAATLVSPEILVEKAPSGEMNFIDLIPAPSAEPVPSKAPSKKKEQIEFIVSRFSISGGKLIYLDRTGGQVKKSGVTDLDLSVTNIALKTTKPIGIDIKTTALYEGKPMKVGISGKVDMNLEKEQAKISNLVIKLGKDSILTNVSVKGFKVPDVNFNISSAGFNLDELMGIFSGKQQKTTAPPRKGELTASVNKALKSIPAGLKVNGTIDIQNLSYKKMNVDKIGTKVNISDSAANVNVEEVKAYNGSITTKIAANLKTPGLSYSINDIKLSGFNAGPFLNSVILSFMPGQEGLVDKIEGTLDFSGGFTGAGVEMPEMLRNLKGAAGFEIKKGKIRKLESLSAVGKNIGLSMLQKDMSLSSLKADAKISGGILNVIGLKFVDTDVKADFKGLLDLNEMRYVAGNNLRVVLSKAASADLPAQYEILKDEKGIASLEFELIGSLTKPIPLPKFEKLLQKTIGKETEKVKKEINKAVETEKKKVEEDIKKEVEKGLQNLINPKK